MNNIEIYNQEGEKVGQEKLNSDIFGVEIKTEVIHQVVVSFLANQRHPFAHTKTRGEKRGGGRKPWRQKGTGRARAGSIRSPLWRGGGIVFGPNKNQNFFKKVNKKLKRKALFMCLTSKVQDKKLYILDKLNLTETKTKILFNILSRLIPDFKNSAKSGSASGGKKILLSLPKKDLNIIRSGKNIANLKILPITDLNVLDCLKSEYLVTTVSGIKKIEEHFKPHVVRKS